MSFNFVAAVTVHIDLGAKKMKSDTVSTFFPFICYKVIGPEAIIFVFLNVEF